MADNFGLKIGLEGEKEFKKALSEINQSFKVLGSEMKLVSSQFDKNDSSVQALTARNTVLNKEIEAQKQKIETLRSALDNASASFGENDRRTQNWQVQLNNAEAALNDMERELKQNQDAIDAAGDEFQDAGKQADGFGNEVEGAADDADKSSGKEYCEDPITKHRRKNYGELPQYFVEDTHEAIIPMDEWQAVQAEFKRRRDLGPFGNKSLNLSAFSTKITCGCCGKHYRHSGKRNTAGEVYYIWTCQTKSQKGASACPSKNIPEKMLQNTAAKVLGLDEFDEDAFSKQIEEIIVIGDDTLTFRFYDGHEVTTKWQSTAKTDWWTDERRKLWGERHKRKDTNPNKHLFYEFTGFIKCGCCGANYRCQSGKRKDGTPTRSWYCIGPKDQCRNPGIRDETMKRLVIDVLGLDEFDEAAMDAQIESAAILDHTVTFHFRDGHTESRDFLDKRHGTPWTEERREKARESMKAAWTDKRRKAMSERIKKIRSEKKWPKP